MSKRKPTSATLYELIKKRSGAGAPAEVDYDHEEAAAEEPESAPPPPPPPAGVESSGGSWFAPGRVITVPVGYLLLGAAGVIVVAALTYSVGYTRGREVEQVAHERSILAGDDSIDAAPRPRDPMARRPAANTEVLARPESRDAGRGAVAPVWPPPARSGNEPATPDRWGPIDGDPRVDGFNYFVLMETVVDGAFRLAEYARGEGLETYVVVSHNNPLRRLVIALPGYSPETSRTSPEVQALERRIHRIGERWQRHESGATDLHDAYPDRYDSSPGTSRP